MLLPRRCELVTRFFSQRDESAAHRKRRRGQATPWLQFQASRTRPPILRVKKRLPENGRRSVHVARCRSWLRSVVNSPHKPLAAKRVVINTIEAALRARRAAFQVDRRRKTKMNFKIPFVVLPWIFLPPISRSAPRAGSCNYFSAHAAKRNTCRMPFTQFNFQGQRRPEGSKPRSRFAGFAIFQ